MSRRACPRVMAFAGDGARVPEEAVLVAAVLLTADHDRGVRARV